MKYSLPKVVHAMVSDRILYYKLQVLPASEYRLTHEVGDHITRDRIVSLTDAVLAIVMTLLVLEIVVPELSHSEAATELPKRLLELLPDVWSYAISFIILGFFGFLIMISSATLSVVIEHFSGIPSFI